VPPTPGTPQVLSPKRPATVSEDTQDKQSGSFHPEGTKSPTNVAEAKLVVPSLQQKAEDATNASNHPNSPESKYSNTHEDHAKAESVTKSSVSEVENPAVDTDPELTPAHPEDESPVPVVSKDSYTELACDSSTAANADTI